MHGSFAARGWASKADEPVGAPPGSSAPPVDGVEGAGESEGEEGELATLQGLYVEKEEEVRHTTISAQWGATAAARWGGSCVWRGTGPFVSRRNHDPNASTG